MITRRLYARAEERVRIRRFLIELVFYTSPLISNLQLSGSYSSLQRLIALYNPVQPCTALYSFVAITKSIAKSIIRAVTISIVAIIIRLKASRKRIIN